MCTVKQLEGFSLIELLLSLLVLMLLTVIIMQYYCTHSQNYIKTKKSFNNFYDVVMIIEQMRASIRSAGFTPCVASNLLLSNDCELSLPIQIINNNQQRLRISRMDNNFTIVTSVLANNNIELDDSLDLHAHDLILITDCMHGELHTIQEVTNNSKQLLLNKTLFFDYVAPIYIGKWITEDFFIQSTKSKHQALYYKYHKAEILSSNIDQMMVTITQKIKKILTVDLFKERQKIAHFNVTIRAS